MPTGVLATIRAQGSITFVNISDEPQTWENALVIQFCCNADFTQAKDDGECRIAIEPKELPSKDTYPETLSPPLGTYRGGVLPITLLHRRFFRSARIRYHNALILAFESKGEMARAVAEGKIRLRNETLSKSEPQDYAAWLCEREERLADDPAYFAFIAMQSSCTKHSNEKSAARDQYYFGSILCSAISDQRDMMRLFAMAELTEDRLAPFSDDSSNYLLAALRKVCEIECRKPTLAHVIDALDVLGLLGAAGGRTKLERQFARTDISSPEAPRTPVSPTDAKPDAGIEFPK